MDDLSIAVARAAQLRDLVRFRLKALRMTQATLCEVTKISQSSMSMWINNKLDARQVESINLKICRWMKIAYNDDIPKPHELDEYEMVEDAGISLPGGGGRAKILKFLRLRREGSRNEYFVTIDKPPHELWVRERDLTCYSLMAAFLQTNPPCEEVSRPVQRRNHEGRLKGGRRSTAGGSRKGFGLRHRQITISRLRAHLLAEHGHSSGDLNSLDRMAVREALEADYYKPDFEFAAVIRGTHDPIATAADHEPPSKRLCRPSEGVTLQQAPQRLLMPVSRSEFDWTLRYADFIHCHDMARMTSLQAIPTAPAAEPPQTTLTEPHGHIHDVHLPPHAGQECAPAHSAKHETADSLREDDKTVKHATPAPVTVSVATPVAVPAPDDEPEPEPEVPVGEVVVGSGAAADKTP